MRQEYLIAHRRDVEYHKSIHYMEIHMVVSKVPLVLLLAALAGCASPPATEQAPASPPAAAAQQTAANAPLDEPMTGSRIRKRNADGGDRTVKTVGAQDARNALDTSVRPLNSN
jgi:hypothetical protein